MIDQLKKILLTGYGLGLMTRDKIEEFVKKAAEETKMSGEEARKLADDLLTQSKETREHLEEEINSQVKKSMEKLNWATKEELKKLEDRIQALEEKFTEVKTSEESE